MAGSVKMFDQTLKALLDGGEAPAGGGGKVELPPTTDEDIREQLKHVVNSMYKSK